MTNAAGQIHSGAGTPVRNTKIERCSPYVYECHSRQATPEEIERYFGMAKKDNQAKPVSPTARVPEETKESRAKQNFKIKLDALLKAAREVDEHKYKAMKAAVLVIGKVNGYK